MVLCAPPLVPSVISWGAPCPATWKTSVSEGRNRARNGQSILPVIPTPTSHRNFLQAANLRHGANGFTSLLKEGMLRNFSSEKTRQLWLGLNPQTRVLEASMLTTRQPNLLLSGMSHCGTSGTSITICLQNRLSTGTSTYHLVTCIQETVDIRR
jgi:hypothetical protein